MYLGSLALSTSEEAGVVQAGVVQRLHRLVI